MYWLFYATSALLFFITLTTVVLMSFSRWRPWATVSIAVWSGLTFLLALLADIRGAAELEPDDYLSASFSLLAMGSYVVLGIVIAVGTTILLWRATARPSPAARQTLTTS